MEIELRCQKTNVVRQKGGRQPAQNSKLMAHSTSSLRSDSEAKNFSSFACICQDFSRILQDNYISIDYLYLTGLHHKTKAINIHKNNTMENNEYNTVATDEEIANGIRDEYECVYSRDGKRLLKAFDIDEDIEGNECWWYYRNDIVSYTIKKAQK